MARIKVKTECRLKSWGDVDNTLKQLADCERIHSDLTSNMNAEIDAVKKRYAELAKPVQEHIDHYYADIWQFVTERRGDMEGKTKALNFGRVGFRISGKLKYRKGVRSSDVITTLLRLNLDECIMTKRTVLRGMLKKQNIDVLGQVGAYLDKSDEFWLETKREEIQPATDREDQP